jgi:hypothetical protein
MLTSCGCAMMFSRSSHGPAIIASVYTKRFAGHRMQGYPSAALGHVLLLLLPEPEPFSEAADRVVSLVTVQRGAHLKNLSTLSCLAALFSLTRAMPVDWQVAWAVSNMVACVVRLKHRNSCASQ